MLKDAGLAIPALEPKLEQHLLRVREARVQSGGLVVGSGQSEPNIWV